MYENNNSTTELIQMIELDNDDIERSEVVKKVIKIYDDKL
jgi:hypothetical protein